MKTLPAKGEKNRGNGSCDPVQHQFPPPEKGVVPDHRSRPRDCPIKLCIPFAHVLAAASKYSNSRSKYADRSSASKFPFVSVRL